jgi:cytochrome c
MWILRRAAAAAARLRVNARRARSVILIVAERRSAAAPGRPMKTFQLATIVTACMVSAPAWANQDLAQKKNCMACHAISQKVIGPAYKEVATKYAGQPDAVAKLVPKVMKGGSGVWGAVPMPANPQVNEAEAKQLVQWILSLK